MKHSHVLAGRCGIGGYQARALRTLKAGQGEGTARSSVAIAASSSQASAVPRPAGIRAFVLRGSRPCLRVKVS